MVAVIARGDSRCRCSGACTDKTFVMWARSRQVALTMLDFIRDAFKQDLEGVKWMTEVRNMWCKQRIKC